MGRGRGSATVTTIAGLNPWSDIHAKNATNTGDGTNVTQYVDSSGNDRHFTPSAGTQVYNENSGKPYIQMTSAVAECNSTMPNYWGKTVYVVLKSSVASALSIHGVKEKNGFQYDGLWVEGTADRLYYYHGDGTSTTAGQVQLGAGEVQNKKHIYCTESSSGHTAIMVDGLYKGVFPKSYEAWDVVTTPTIGGSYRTQNGQFERIIVFDKLLNKEEHDIVVGELSTEHTEFGDGGGETPVNLWSSISSRCYLAQFKGQSNADGRESVSAANANTNENFLSVTGVNLSVYDGTQTGSYIWNGSAFVSTVLNLAGGTSNTSNLSNRMGIHAFFGKDLYDDKSTPVYQVNSSLGGTILYDDGITNSTSLWHPKVTTEATNLHLNGGAIFDYYEALFWLQDNSLRPYDPIFIKWQGEQDANVSATAANAYQANESLWNTNLGDSVGDTTVKIHTVRLHDDNDATDQPYLSTVIAAQNTNASSTNTVYDPSSETLFDITHVTAAGMKNISDLIINNI